MTTPHLKVILNPHLNKARKRWGNGGVPKSNHQNLNLSDFQFIAKKLCWPCHSVSTPSIFVRNPQCYHWYNYAANHQAGYRPWWWKDPRKSWPTWENVQLYTSLEKKRFLFSIFNERGWFGHPFRLSLHTWIMGIFNSSHHRKGTKYQRWTKKQPSKKPFKISNQNPKRASQRHMSDGKNAETECTRTRKPSSVWKMVVVL